MKRFLITAAALTLLAATPVFALDTPQTADRPEQKDHERTTVIDDVIRMAQAGVDDDTIIKFIRNSKNLYVVDADVIIALTDAKVSKPVLDAVLDEAYDRGTARADRRDRGRTRTVYVRPYYAWDPWYSYDPFWYGPRISFGWGWGGGWYRPFRPSHPRHFRHR